MPSVIALEQFIESRDAVSARQLALYVECGINPRRIDPVTRTSLAMRSALFNWRDALVVERPDALIRWHRVSWRCQRRTSARGTRPRNCGSTISDFPCREGPFASALRRTEFCPRQACPWPSASRVFSRTRKSVMDIAHHRPTSAALARQGERQSIRASGTPAGSFCVVLEPLGLPRARRARSRSRCQRESTQRSHRASWRSSTRIRAFGSTFSARWALSQPARYAAAAARPTISTTFTAPCPTQRPG